MKTILLIDSDQRRRELYARILSRRGHSVLHAQSAQSAREQVARRPVDLCVVDSELEDATGTGFLKASCGELGAAKVVFLSTFFQQDSRLYDQLTRELGVELVLHKPIAPLEFGVQIDNLLEAPDTETLTADSTVEREVGDMREAFIDELRAELEELSDQVRSARREPVSADQLSDARQVARRLQSVAGRHGYFDVGQSAGALEQALERVEEVCPEERTSAWSAVDTALRNARASSLHLESNRDNGAGDEPTNSAPPPTSTVLLVDDDQEFVDKAQSLGDQLLIHVCQATSSQEALHKLDECASGPEAIFINVDMGDDFDAFSLVRQIRARGEAKPTPLAFISEEGKLRDRVQAAHAGAVLFLDKPVDSTEFSQAVHQLVSLKRAAQPTVLVIDDDRDFVGQARRLFDAHDMVLAHLDDSTDVLQQLERTNPDAVVINATMSGVSGFDLCRMLRTIPRWQDLPIVFVSDKGGLDARVAAFRGGADDFLLKPVAAEELLARVEVRIERSRLMRQRADRDVLTGLLTRRAFLEAVAARISEVRRKGKPLAFCLLDLDHFKQINDTHGHIAGDRVLAGLGRLLQNRFRFEDLRGRWGGEEFAIAIVNEDAATAKKVLERIQKEFEAVEFEGADGQTFQVTFSAGIAQVPGDGQEADQLLKTADERLYAAKAAGRNQIFCDNSAASD
ncbi:response regulator [Persicimonas caeni]|uniref:Response regulator n=1 Tax=Persicimonas caeni TaxID=2292766 RepID=A0A4Y6PXY2_PERCE|nr:response regulator [Persicimonas caeni]QDG53182.1 response regulator [Persicimonas caeni]QED34404.1 response regulator [Persicimonas caeni]